MQRLVLGLLTILFAAAIAVWGGIPIDSVAAQEASSTSSSAQPDPMQEVTPAREAAALTFAQLHHPELANLLKKLKAHPGKDYEDAIRDLFKASERLARLKVRTPDRYEMELQLWKIDSRVRLLAARSTMEDSDKLAQELRQLLREKRDVQADLLRQERDKQAARLEKMNSDLEALLADPDAAEQEAERLVKSAKARAATQARNNRNPKPATPETKKPANSQTTSAEPGPQKTPAKPQ